jgi:uncharacterized membrane protein YfbV (UPF0208 family)
MDTPNPTAEPASNTPRGSLAAVLIVLALVAVTLVPVGYLAGYFLLGNKGSARLANGQLIWFRVYPSYALEQAYRPLARVESAAFGEQVDTASR